MKSEDRTAGTAIAHAFKVATLRDENRLRTRVTTPVPHESRATTASEARAAAIAAAIIGACALSVAWSLWALTGVLASTNGGEKIPPNRLLLVTLIVVVCVIALLIGCYFLLVVGPVLALRAGSLKPAGIRQEVGGMTMPVERPANRQHGAVPTTPEPMPAPAEIPAQEPPVSSVPVTPLRSAFATMTTDTPDQRPDVSPQPPESRRGAGGTSAGRDIHPSTSATQHVSAFDGYHVAAVNVARTAAATDSAWYATIELLGNAWMQSHSTTLNNLLDSYESVDATDMDRAVATAGLEELGRQATAEIGFNPLSPDSAPGWKSAETQRFLDELADFLSRYRADPQTAGPAVDLRPLEAIDLDSAPHPRLRQLLIDIFQTIN